MNKKILFVLVPLLAFPTTIFAAEAVYKVTVLPENFESVVELVNLVISLLAGFYAVKLAALSQGGAMEKTWNLLAGASVAFALVEITNSLKGFGLVELGGLEEIFEAALGILLLVVFVKTRKILLKQVLGK